MDAFTLQPAAGAHGELTGLLIMKAALRDQGELARDTILIPTRPWHQPCQRGAGRFQSPKDPFSQPRYN